MTNPTPRDSAQLPPLPAPDLETHQFIDGTARSRPVWSYSTQAVEQIVSEALRAQAASPADMAVYQSIADDYQRDAQAASVEPVVWQWRIVRDGESSGWSECKEEFAKYLTDCGAPWEVRQLYAGAPPARIPADVGALVVRLNNWRSSGESEWAMGVNSGIDAAVQITQAWGRTTQAYAREALRAQAASVEPYAYEVPGDSKDSRVLAFAPWFHKYGNPLPDGAIPLYLGAPPAHIPADVEALIDCDIKPRPLNYSLRDYHVAMSEGPLNSTWKDKPHRLVYDLIAAVRYYATPQPHPVAASSPATAVDAVDEREPDHVLKTDPDAFDAVASGIKTHEIRKDDRGFKVGDVLLLKRTRYTGAQMHMRPEACPLEYTGDEVRRTVSHIQRGYGLGDHWVILSFAALAASTGANVDAGMVPLTAMRKAFVTSESFGPDRRYELVFKFESLVDLQAAHREWVGGIQASGGAE